MHKSKVFTKAATTHLNRSGLCRRLIHSPSNGSVAAPEALQVKRSRACELSRPACFHPSKMKCRVAHQTASPCLFCRLYLSPQSLNESQNLQVLSFTSSSKNLLLFVAWWHLLLCVLLLVFSSFILSTLFTLFLILFSLASVANCFIWPSFILFKFPFYEK